MFEIGRERMSCVQVTSIFQCCPISFHTIWVQNFQEILSDIFLSNFKTKLPRKSSQSQQGLWELVGINWNLNAYFSTICNSIYI